VNLCSQLPWGLVLDFLGPRVCNMWSTIIVVAGFILLATSARGATDAFLLVSQRHNQPPHLNHAFAHTLR